MFYLLFFCLAEYEYMAVCRLSQEYIVGKILRVGQALDLRGYYQTMLVYLLRDWLKKALPHGLTMTRMDITCLRLDII